MKKIIPVSMLLIVGLAATASADIQVCDAQSEAVCAAPKFALPPLEDGDDDGSGDGADDSPPPPPPKFALPLLQDADDGNDDGADDSPPPPPPKFELSPLESKDQDPRPEQPPVG